ncbi:NTP pyrophosphohydrolase [Vibrio phage 1.189.B._10N.286.51.B5]|nr:NTP pyrophosphohydrolase [Vibrio phage 1.189.B._10N.286.51.B5]AUR93930.1 NTP pyrophosphohydrolase [Vibrio phage 1.189.C._10N.286.51.B5]AUR93996.1 NTP pyrophosphohydrolase [Vibrio phage 1.189.O._10N.286.51.B5]
MINSRESNDMLDYKIQMIAEWHHARNLVDGATDAAQFVKLMEEVGELAGNLARSKDIRDDIGDIIVVLVNLLERNGLTLKECVDVAYEDIKDRRGRMINGSFVKEADL